MPNGLAVFRQACGLDAGNLFQLGAQVVGVFPAACRFAHELVDLLHQNHGLKLLHSVVAAAWSSGS